MEGMKERELLDGDPSKVPNGDDEEQDHDEDDDELDDGDDGGPGPSGGKVSKKLFLMTQRISSTRTKIQKR